MVDLVKCEVCDRELWLSFTKRFRKGHIPWNKGLTKETDKRVAKNSGNLREQHYGSIIQETKQKKTWVTRRKRYGRTGMKNLTVEQLEHQEWVQKRHSEFMKRKNPMSNSEFRLKIGLKNIERWNKYTSEQREKKILELILGGQRKPNSIEQKILQIVSKYFLPFKFTGYKPYSGLNGYTPDFISTDDSKKIIEVFGDYWHKRKEVVVRDVKRLRIYKEKGFECLILWEQEIRSSTEQELVERIRQFCSTPQILNTTVYD